MEKGMYTYDYIDDNKVVIRLSNDKDLECDTFDNIYDIVSQMKKENTEIVYTYDFDDWANIMINKIYCDICSQASVETLQIITEETFYCCTMCRDNNEDREIKDNNFYEDCVIDYKS